jgi:asparagine synthetase B (glutamine-hydrolysing)
MIDASEGTDGWPDDGASLVEGDPTGARITYVRLGGDRLIQAQDLRSLLPGMDRLEIDDISLSHLLHDGFVPFPRTIFKNVQALGIGDRVAVTGEGQAARLEFAVDFPYLSRHSRQDQAPDPERLLRLLSASLERSLAPHAGAVLMMSSGLDSASLGLAAAEIGRASDVAALTFDQNGTGEGAAAAAFARRFGLRHLVLEFPQSPKVVADLALEFFAVADQPCCDPVVLAYVATLRQAGVNGGLVLDGSGSDIYLGEVPTRRAHVLDALHRLPDAWLASLQAMAPFGSPLNKVASSRGEKTFAETYHLRHRETRRFFAGSVDSAARWRLQDREGAGMSLTDFDAFTGGRHQDANRSMLKARLAVAARGGAIAFPWCDPDLIAYCFNLPEEQRRGSRRAGNKPLVRAMLRRHAATDALARRKHKHVFSFFLPEFLRANRNLVEHEIGACRLWARSVHETTAALWRILDERPGTAVALHALFGVSAWLNHASVLKRSAANRPMSSQDELASCPA